MHINISQVHKILSDATWLPPGYTDFRHYQVHAPGVTIQAVSSHRERERRRFMDMDRLPPLPGARPAQEGHVVTYTGTLYIPHILVHCTYHTYWYAVYTTYTGTLCVLHILVHCTCHIYWYAVLHSTYTGTLYIQHVYTT
jgi:hypothetical protein